jgi:hypothetical protein
VGNAFVDLVMKRADGDDGGPGPERDIGHNAGLVLIVVIFDKAIHGIALGEPDEDFLLIGAAVAAEEEEGLSGKGALAWPTNGTKDLGTGSQWERGRKKWEVSALGNIHGAGEIHNPRIRLKARANEFTGVGLLVGRERGAWQQQQENCDGE